MSKYIKMISDFNNPYFSNNKLMTGTEIPTDGTYAKGDIIVNIGEGSVEAPMWICVEAGTPGVWEVVGVGSGGGSSRLGCIKSRVVVDQEVTEVAIGIGGFNKATDVLLVFANGELMSEGVDYEINEDSTKIVGKWNEVMASDFTFDFVVMKSMNNDGSISSGSELICLRNTVVVNEAVNEVEIGIEGFNKETDLLTVYRNTVYMIEGVDYRVEGNKIVSLKGNWNTDVGADYKFTFEVMKLVAKVNPDAVIGMEHLNEDVREAIEAAGNIDLSKYDNKLAELESRVEEAFTSANNGKELIASAIGEPLNAEDTFSAMSNDINSLLNTFKTNMMNNGVTVEANDRFKSLIDKIITMVEEGSNKGIQFASGMDLVDETGNRGSVSLYSGNDITLYYSNPLKFTPTYLFVIHKFSDGSNSIYCNLCRNSYSGSTGVINVTQNSFDLSRGSNGTVTVNISNVTYYAIGVGEEDTTLRDSLASILQEEGVTVTEEDNMANLITKVDEEFDKKNAEINNNKGLDIISATSLPATGNEGQICVITESEIGTPIIKCNDVSDNSGNVILHTNTGNANYSYLSGNMGCELNLYRATLNNKWLKAYVYSSGSWKLLCDNTLTFTLTGYDAIDNLGGTIATNSSYDIERDSSVGLILPANASEVRGSSYSIRLNFSEWSRIDVVAKCTNTSVTTYLDIICAEKHGVIRGQTWSGGVPLVDSRLLVNSTSYKTYTFYISEYGSGFSGYLTLMKYSSNNEIHIKSVTIHRK